MYAGIYSADARIKSENLEEEKVHIVFLIHAFPEPGRQTGGGAGNYVANMSRILCRNGHKVRIITESDSDSIFEWEGIEIRHIRATRYFRDTGRKMTVWKKTRKNLWRSIFYNYEVYKINKEERIDVVQSVSVFSIAFLRCRKIPYLIRLSDYPTLMRAAVRECYSFNEAIRQETIDDKLFYLTIKKADALVAPSVLMQRLITKRTGKEVTVVESPFISSDYEGDKNLQKSKYFLSFGFLNYRKGIHTLAQIIDRLLDEYKDMEYIIVGKDCELETAGGYIRGSQLVKSMVTRNRERLIIRGEIYDRGELFSLIKNSYLCILPSRIDNLANSWLEAMGLGKIVISSDQSSAEQLIMDGYNGYLAPIDDAEALYHKIKCAMQLSESDRKKMEDRAKKRIETLAPEKVYEKMMVVYRETIDNFNRKQKKVYRIQ